MKYTFCVETMISLHLTVEAETLEAAVEEAKNSSTMSLCHQCARGEPDEWSTSGELDDDPASAYLVDFHSDDSGCSFEHAAEAWGNDD